LSPQCVEEGRLLGIWHPGLACAPCAYEVALPLWYAVVLVEMSKKG